MQKQLFKKKFISNFSFLPTQSQIDAIEALSGFLSESGAQSLFILRGYAGTGKTTLMRSFVQTLYEFNIKTVLLAPTGRAAKVLSNYVGLPSYTIHKKIYRQSRFQDGFGSFNLNDNLHKNTIFIVDEASMISNESSGNSVFGTGRLLDDLISYVYGGDNCRLVLLGDTAQLPPVETSLSPALDKGELAGYASEVWETVLTDVLRQEENSGILANATKLREMLDQDEELSGFPIIDIDDYTDIRRISGGDLIEEINYCYDNYGLEETLIITRSNKRANLYNQGIRNTVLHKEEELAPGDFLLIVKNNYHWIKEHEEISFIANGDIAKVIRIKKYHELYGLRFADITCELTDYRNVEIDTRVILDTIHSEGPGLNHEQQELFYSAVMEDYQDISVKRKRYEALRSDEFYNSLQIKFAYAMTCHKAQGGQWKAVFVDLGYFTEEHLSRDFLRWLYTAFTRATERLYLVNFPKEFFKY